MRRQMDNEVGPDQLVVVLDAQGASALQVTRKAQLCKDTAVTLNKVTPSFRPMIQLRAISQELSCFTKQCRVNFACVMQPWVCCCAQNPGRGV